MASRIHRAGNLNPTPFTPEDYRVKEKPQGFSDPSSAVATEPERPGPHLYLAPVPPPGWDLFARSSGSYLFSTTAWTEAVAAGFESEVLFAALMDGDEIVVALIGIQRKAFGFRVFHSFFPYGGLTGDPSRGDELLDLLIPVLKARRYHTLVVEDPFCALPERHVTDPTYGRRHVRLMNDHPGGGEEDALFRSYHKSVKKNVRRAREAGLVVTEATTDEEVEQIFELYRRAMERNKAPTWYPKKLFFELLHRLVPSGDARYLIVKDEGRVIGMLAMVYSKGGAHYWMGGSSFEALKLRVNDLLFHEAIRISAERGDAFFDLMGSAVDDDQLARFKEKWGGVSQDVLGYHLDLAPLRTKLFRLAYRFVRHGPGAWVIRKLNR